MQPLWKTVWRFLKKLKIELLYDPLIPLVGIYPEKTKFERHLHPNVHSTVCNSQDSEHPKWPSADEWVKMMWHIYTMEQYSDIYKKKEWNNVICSNMNGPGDYHTRWSKRKTNTICYHLYVESKIWHTWTC